jgi:hypothetical protein
MVLSRFAIASNITIVEKYLMIPIPSMPSQGYFKLSKNTPSIHYIHA